MNTEGIKRVAGRPVVAAGLLVAVGWLGYWLGATRAEDEARSARVDAEYECESRARDVEYQVSRLDSRISALER